MELIRFNLMLNSAHATESCFHHMFGIKTFWSLSNWFLIGIFVCSFLFAASGETLLTYARGKKETDLFGLNSFVQYTLEHYEITLWRLD